MKKFSLVLLILVWMIILTGCCCWVCNTPQPQCSLTVVANSSRVWGWIVIDGNPTGEYINPYESITIYDVPCNKTVIVYIVDDCGAVSHKEYVYVSGTTNYAYFNYWDYWDDYWYKNSDSKEHNDKACNYKS